VPFGTDLNVAGISRSGSTGSYVYSVIGDGDRPVTYVSWFDAARMANWMQNGQPTGVVDGPTAATEYGAYTLNGDTTSGLETKNANALYWIPSENEWYKAAYYDPALNGGAGGYWSYATKSNTAPGNNPNTPSVPNQANYRIGGIYSVTQTNSISGVNALTDVGLFSNSASSYGTYDQTGDVWTWNDAVIDTSDRGIRGSYWGSSGVGAYYRSDDPPTEANDDAIGIRLATVPEPTVAISLIIGAGLLMGKRSRARRSAIAQ